MYLRLFVLTLGMTLHLVACEKKASSPSSGAFLSADSAPMPLSASPKAVVKRMRADLLRNNLAKILVLNPKGMCLELGELPCADLVHKVSLGGMNAYGNAQYHYPEQISSSSSMSLDRLVLSACVQRTSMDFNNPNQAVIFKVIELNPDGRLDKSDAVTSIRILYQRAFLRDPSPSEIDALLQFYEAVYAKQPIAPALNWGVLSCFAVLTSVEAAFY